MLCQITPLALTYNEAPNIRRTLEKLTWAKNILVVDSFSTDETLDIVKAFPQVRILQRAFDTFAGQCNFGLEHVKAEWVLSLDADYILSDELNRELSTLSPSAGTAGYSAKFVYCIYGRPLRASLYPPRTVLYRKIGASYRDEGHGHRVQLEGIVIPLKSVIYHDDRKPLARWFGEQLKYAQREAKHLLEAEVTSAPLSRADRIRRKVILAPFLVFFYTLIGKGLVLDGWPGWFYVLQRTLAEIILSLCLLERKLREAENKE